MLRYGLNGRIIKHGPAEEIREHVRNGIKRGWLGGRFVLDTESLDISTPAEHLDIAMEAAREYGRLPLRI